MKLHLIRHADRELYAISGHDFDCQITELGKKQSRLLGDHSQSLLQGLEVWCSDAKRTRQTLEILKEKIDFADISYFSDFHLCPKEVYLENIWKSQSKNDLVIIGHNFGISELVGYLTGEHITMQTAQLVSIEFNVTRRNEISGDTGTIIYQYCPDHF